jgi:hypothetical protein
MGIYVHNAPVNPAQVIAALGSEGCTVRADDDAGTWEVDVPGHTSNQVGDAVAATVYDDSLATVAEAEAAK